MVRRIGLKCRDMRRRGRVSNRFGSSRESWCTVCRSECSSDSLDLLLACLHNPAVSCVLSGVYLEKDRITYLIVKIHHPPFRHQLFFQLSELELRLTTGMSPWDASWDREGGLTWRTSSWRRIDCHGIPSGGWRECGSRVLERE